MPRTILLAAALALLAATLLPASARDRIRCSGHEVAASTWKQPGSTDDKVAVTVDLETAFGKLASPSE